MATRLTDTEIQAQLSQFSEWSQVDNKIQRLFKFKNFVEAVDFVNQLVEPAEAADHHPDIEISYNKVTVNLTTHDAGGLTQKDFDLAGTFNQL
ncbi:4a-hydroxytetrahydrobiopterin dehydratase [Picosynechococcus sp. PCC 7003]|uniref:4a-hydroxytetrahydrobiopterin dehydratase n=1 Tax=Picosynechococcus sp. PCC 7003 TaxID=374981 RepID=UPI00081087D0|nr:4a-hydroxytetrahydrobiopterin dehydratase [Picosynechococcus sp. PCC 7003]ANV85396.1 4a-hydroxytetrahydrobiopterin dehydratase [Picosynechococcus sp. PCC 7003]